MKTLQEIIAEYSSLKTQIQDLIKAALPNGKKMIAQAIKELILKVEGLEAVNWKQYIPSFNDGDACEFGLGEVTFKFESIDDEGDNEDGFLCTYAMKRLGLSDKQESCGEISNFINSIPEEILESIFYSNASVTVYKNGKVEVDDYYV